METVELQTVERESFSVFCDRWRAEHPDQVWETAPSSCSLCGYMPQVQGGSMDDAWEAMKVHRDSHADWAEWDAKNLGDLVERLHQDCDHTSVGKCRCICGCESELRADCKSFPEGPLCTMCSWRHDVRGDDDHDDPARLWLILQSVID